MSAWDLSAINTAPGSCETDPFSPPASFSGGSQDYIHLCRQRWSDVGYAQRMLMVAKHYGGTRYFDKPVVVSGPFRAEAMTIIHKLMNKE